MSGTHSVSAFQHTTHKPYNEKTAVALPPGESPSTTTHKFSTLNKGKVDTRPCNRFDSQSRSSMRKARGAKLSRPEFASVTKKPQQPATLDNSKKFWAASTYKSDFQTTAEDTRRMYTKPCTQPKSELAVAVQRDVLGRNRDQTSYQIDLCEAPAANATHPNVRSTKDLCAGTTLNSYHMSGYCGHVPAAVNNLDAIPFVRYPPSRKTKNDDRASYKPNMPGCTAYRPTCAKNDKGPLRVDPNLTTTLSAYENGVGNMTA